MWWLPKKKKIMCKIILQLANILLHFIHFRASPSNRQSRLFYVTTQSTTSTLTTVTYCFVTSTTALATCGKRRRKRDLGEFIEQDLEINPQRWVFVWFPVVWNEWKYLGLMMCPTWCHLRTQKQMKDKESSPCTGWPRPPPPPPPPTPPPPQWPPSPALLAALRSPCVENKPW